MSFIKFSNYGLDAALVVTCDSSHLSTHALYQQAFSHRGIIHSQIRNLLADHYIQALEVCEFVVDDFFWGGLLSGTLSPKYMGTLNPSCLSA